MKRTKPFGVGIGPKMSSALAMMVVLGVVTGLTLPATAANIPWPPTVAKEDSNRDKSGTSAVRIEQVPSQAPENKTVMTGDAFQAERGRFELPRPFRADRFSKPAHSAALPPLRECVRSYRKGFELARFVCGLPMAVNHGDHGARR